MKKAVIAAAYVLFAVSAFAQSGYGGGSYGQNNESHYTRGHYRRNGTYVEGHRSSNPNNTTSDNWSTKGNYNPYTGKQGTRNPY